MLNVHKWHWDSFELQVERNKIFHSLESATTVNSRLQHLQISQKLWICNFSWNSVPRLSYSWNVVTELCRLSVLPSDILRSFPHHLFSGSVGHKMDTLSTANTEFCLDVFKELNSNNVGDNIFFSPLSLLYALSMVLLGARGNSAEQMEKVWNTVKISSWPRGHPCTPLGQPNSHISRNSSILWKKKHLGKSYFLKMNNGINNVIIIIQIS